MATDFSKIVKRTGTLRKREKQPLPKIPLKIQLKMEDYSKDHGGDEDEEYGEITETVDDFGPTPTTIVPSTMGIKGGKRRRRRTRKTRRRRSRRTRRGKRRR